MNPFEILATLVSIVIGLWLLWVVIVISAIVIWFVRFWWMGRRARREYERRVGLRR